MVARRGMDAAGPVTEGPCGRGGITERGESVRLQRRWLPNAEPDKSSVMPWPGHRSPSNRRNDCESLKEVQRFVSHETRWGALTWPSGKILEGVVTGFSYSHSLARVHSRTNEFRDNSDKWRFTIRRTVFDSRDRLSYINSPFDEITDGENRISKNKKLMDVADVCKCISNRL